jgi:hypothetical protein
MLLHKSLILLINLIEFSVINLIANMNKIDLTELSKRESERVEWKENVAGIEDIIKTK